MTPATSDSQTFQLTGAHLTLVGALLYATGFFVANSHFGTFVPFQANILSARYLAAAAWFLVWQVFPLATVLMALERSSRFARGPDGEKLAKRNPDATLVGVTDLVKAFPKYWWGLGLGLFFHTYGLGLIRLGETRDQHLPSVVSFLISSFILLAFLRIFFPVFSADSNKEGAGPAAGWTFLVGWVLVPFIVLAGNFAWWSYPRISASVGGGTGWLAEVSVDSPRAPLRALGPGSHQVVLADFASDFISVVTCQGENAELLPVIIPRDAVVELALIREVRMSRGVLEGLLCEQP